MVRSEACDTVEEGFAMLGTSALGGCAVGLSIVFQGNDNLFAWVTKREKKTGKAKMRF